MHRILASVNELQPDEIRGLYSSFNSSILALDCGRKCAPHNPTGKPFCCDICQAVPAAYRAEREYLLPRTDLWHDWRGDECGEIDPEERPRLLEDTPDSMVLLACLGPEHCQRNFRALSCRQFPFFPYVSDDYRFLGLACEWEFETRCWIISNLSRVSPRYRNEFVETFDGLFALFQDEFEAYACHSERLRAHYHEAGRRFPLLHRNGHDYLVSPGNGRIRRIDPAGLPSYGPYLGKTAKSHPTTHKRL